MIKKLYNKKISSIGLAIFRIFFGLVLLAEVLQFFYFRHLIFDYIPYIEESEIRFRFPIIIWAISVILIIFGLFTRPATIVNYILSLSLIGSIKSYEYHMFYAYMGINFLLIFLPISQTLSLDRLLLKYKYSNTRFNYIPPTKVSVLSYYIPIMVGLAFVYFDSIFFKFSSSFWTKGLGVWLPSSIPVNVLIPMQVLLNQEYLMYFLGYLTLAFETIFIFTFFRKKWRLPLMLVGWGLHIGILLSYPIPLFALGMCAIYVLMVPVSFWDKIGNLIVYKKPIMTFFYDAECPLCNRTKITIQCFDIQKAIDFQTVQSHSQNYTLLEDYTNDELLDNVFSIKKDKVYQGIDTYIQVLSSIFYLKPISWFLRIPGVYQIGKKIYNYIAVNRNTERCTEESCGYIPPNLPIKDVDIKLLNNLNLKDLKIGIITCSLTFICILQFLITYNSGVNVSFRKKLQIEDNYINQKFVQLSSKMETSTRTLLGITHHAVFMDYHFNEYNHILSTVYINKDGKEIWLPTINQNGTPGKYQFGFTWVKRTFRTNGNSVNQSDLERGLRDFTAFWAHKNKVNLEDATFIIKLKKIDIPTEWEKDFLEKQMEKPWKDVGMVHWKEKKFNLEIPDIESL